MLFNSYEFLFLFFPATLILFLVASRFGTAPRIVVMLLASLLFYAWWDARFLALLMLSIGANYSVGVGLTNLLASNRRRAARRLLAAGVTFNLALLGVFKYAHFIVENFAAATGVDIHLAAIILPLGISFFTFEQIGYLIDLMRGAKYRADFLRYAVFVSFFPRLVAGPILRYHEIVPQLEESAQRRPVLSDLAAGLSIFFLGLVKKSLLADGVAPHGTAVFAAVASNTNVDFLTAWSGALAYTCQLYFDFSGYSDMAIGAARCFGVQFPMNFNSPYKSFSIVEFWRRWHITLSRFLRDYLYIALGGNRRGPVRRYLNLFITMLLGGLWHGANWTFLAWGALHGFYLMVNHATSAVADRVNWVGILLRSRSGRAFSFLLTFLAVVVGWVFFRAPNFHVAANILSSMVGAHGVSIPAGFSASLRPVAGLLRWLGVAFSDVSGSELGKTLSWVACLLTIAWFLPNTQEFLVRSRPVLETAAIERDLGAPVSGIRRARRLCWSMNWGWAIVIGSVAYVGIISITRVSEFLYWQF